MRRRNKRCCLHELAGLDLHDTFNGGLQVGLFIVIQNALCVNHTSPLTLPTLSITLLTHSPLAPQPLGGLFSCLLLHRSINVVLHREIAKLHSYD